MQFYLATSFLFPTSFRARLFALCFVATHVPLLSYIVWGAATGRIAAGEVILLLLATVIGAGIALAGMGALLRPVDAAAEALRTLESGGKVAPLPVARGDVVGTLLSGVNRAAGAAEARASALDLAAHEDVLTGVRNRRGFLADVAAADAGGRGAIVLIDLDHFKQVNDRLGHDAGDRVLRGFAERLSGELRRRDLLARWGGEEFAMLFWDVTEEEAVRVLERVARTLIGDPIERIEGRAVTFSAGVARYRQGGLDAALGEADEALYLAKHGGRNRVVAAAQARQSQYAG